MRVLVVEDDPELGGALETGLRQLGFTVDRVRDGVAAVHAFDVESFDAVLLDLGLPRLDGRALIRRLRAQPRSRVPVLVLTARDALDERVAALDEGADDFLVKPAALAEIAARLRALIRRAAGHAGGAVTTGDLTLDMAAHSATWRGSPVELSPREFALLADLALHAGRVRSREQLESTLYDWDRAIESNAIEVHVHHLRRKLDPALIRTVRGVGYLMPQA